MLLQQVSVCVCVCVRVRVCGEPTLTGSEVLSRVVCYEYM